MDKGKRYLELNAIRGVVICGIIVTNSVYFAYAARQRPDTFCYNNTLNFIKKEVVRGLMATIFAFLFGFLKLLMYIDHYHTSFLILSLVLLMYRSKIGKELIKPFSVFGKTFLPTYMLQSVLASLLFYYWGLACYNLLSPLAVDLYALVYLVLIYFFNQCWLSLYGQGTFEWVWRYLSNHKKFIP